MKSAQATSRQTTVRVDRAHIFLPIALNFTSKCNFRLGQVQIPTLKYRSMFRSGQMKNLYFLTFVLLSKDIRPGAAKAWSAGFTGRFHLVERREHQ